MSAAILIGCAPDAVIVGHRPNHPYREPKGIEEEIRAIEAVEPTKVVGLSINLKNADEGMTLDSFEWTIVVKNNGPDTAHGVVAKDILPKSLIWISNDGNYDHVTGIWNIGTLNVNQESRLKIICRVNATGVITNNVSVSGHEVDYDLSNNNDSGIIKVSPASDLAIVKQVNVSQANFNDLVRWKLSVSNNGPDVATGVVVTDILPEGFIYVDSILEKGSYSDGVITL